MKKFDEWLRERHSEHYEENWMRNLAMGGALLGAGMGIGASMKGAAPATPAPTTSAQADNEGHWNSEIGRYKAIPQADGSYIYQSQKGNFKRVPSKLSGGFRFVRVP